MMCDYNIHFVKNEDGLIQFYSGKDPLRVTGIAKMVQILAKLVLSNFNEDFYDWDIGGHLPGEVKSNPRYLTTDEELRDLALIVLDRVVKIYVDNQEKVTDPDERLHSMTLRDAYIDWERDTGVIEYNVVAESGKEAVLRLLSTDNLY